MNFYETVETKLFEKDKNLKLKNANYVIDERDSTINYLSDGIEGSSKFNYATFTGQMTLKTIRRIESKKNLFMVLKEDGIINFPKDDEREKSE